MNDLAKKVNDIPILFILYTFLDPFAFLIDFLS